MSIRKYLPKPLTDEELTNIQVKMETSLVERVKTQMKKDKVSWNEFFRACFQAYLEESKRLSFNAQGAEAGSLRDSETCSGN